MTDSLLSHNSVHADLPDSPGTETHAGVSNTKLLSEIQPGPPVAERPPKVPQASIAGPGLVYPADRFPGVVPPGLGSGDYTYPPIIIEPNPMPPGTGSGRGARDPRGYGFGYNRDRDPRGYGFGYNRDRDPRGYGFGYNRDRDPRGYGFGYGGQGRDQRGYGFGYGGR